MATKNAIATKAKSKGKIKEKPVSAAKVPVKTAPPPQVVEISTRPTPKIMTARGKDPAKKKVSAPVVAAGDKVDPEWTTQMNLHKATAPVTYLMSEDFRPKAVIDHKIWGLGIVVKSQNNRIEVLFKAGKKTLITNYKK